MIRKISSIFILVTIINFIVALPVIENNPEENDGFFEGDMDLTEEQLNEYLYPNKRNGMLREKYRWPGNLVFYDIDPVFDDEQVDQILKGFRELEKHTCVRFMPRTKNTKSYIRITGKSGGCHSAVGYRVGEQTLNLAPNRIGYGCFKLGTVMHETIHALGFYHQQSASDRDNYVSIIKANIKEGREHNFYKQPASTVTDFGVSYDYGSIMHYSAYAFSKNGKKTIIPHDKNAVIGQRDGLSPKDIQKINLMYKCNKFY